MLAAIVGVSGALVGAGASAQENPPIRFDNWLYYQDNTDNSQRWQYRPRFYIPFALNSGATFTQRIDLPMYYTNKVGPDNTTGGWQAGIGDWFLESTYLSPEIDKNMKWSTSLRLVFPTGGKSPFGSSQYQVAPSIGFLASRPENKLTFNPVARYFYSYHATDDSAAKVRRWDIYPTLTKGFDDGWSIAFYPENPISYNDVSNKWFVPFDVLLIKRLSKETELGFGGASAIIKDDPQYRYIVNARLTFYF
jgi:hypothetical protein